MYRMGQLGTPPSKLMNRASDSRPEAQCTEVQFPPSSNSGCHDDHPAKDHLWRDARFRRPRCASLLPRSSLQPPHQDQRRLLAGSPSAIRHRGPVRVPGLRQAWRGYPAGLSAGSHGHRLVDVAHDKAGGTRRTIMGGGSMSYFSFSTFADISGYRPIL